MTALLSTHGAGSSQAKDWRDEIGVFRIGIVSNGDVSATLSRIEPFQRAVTEALRMEVEFFPASTSKALVDALADARIEYALLSASGYALASITCKCVEPLVMPRAPDSTDAYHLVALSRKGSGISISNLHSAKVAILSPDSITGHEMVGFLLAGPDEGNPAKLPDFLALETSEETLRAFDKGRFDVLFGWSSLTGDPAEGYSRGTLFQLERLAPGSASRYEVIWKSPPVPHRPHVVRKNLPGEAKTILRDLLVNLYERDPVAYDVVEPVYGGGFTAARDERFRVFYDFFQSLKQQRTEPSGPSDDDNGNAVGN